MEKISMHEIDLKVKENFNEAVKLNQDNHMNIAKKKLEVTAEKFSSRNLYDKYEKSFQEWLDEEIIEVPLNEVSLFGNYLPHRPIIKESSSTTPIRPVFDASVKFQNRPSLNQCLQCGPNLIEPIPDSFARFIAKEFGIITDIRKAFLQISVFKDSTTYH
ncbi:integrase catalytic domain-containing protein [Trichonephila clavipes]|nr:integrase catalytic domain-containing protein [Trichonephila clavipes]